jgi:hypothetical protein
MAKRCRLVRADLRWPAAPAPQNCPEWPMIAETNFLAEIFYAHSVIFFRQEKSFQDLF